MRRAQTKSILILGLLGSLVSLVAAAQLPAFQDTPQEIDEVTHTGDTERWGQLSFTAPPNYTFCSIDEGDLSTYANTLHANAGLHIVVSSPKLIEYEWWVQGGKAPSEPGVVSGTVTVRWIPETETAQTRAHFCQPWPKAEPVKHENPFPRRYRPPVQPPVIAGPLIYPSEVKTFEEFRGWDDGYAEKDFSFYGKENYEICRLMTTEYSRNPRDMPMDYSGAGYQITSIGDRNVTWRAWVDPDGHLWGSGRWLHVDFRVLWIKTNATTQERIDAGCLKRLPDAVPPHQHPVPDKNGGPAVHNSPATATYWAIDRVVCRDNYDGTEDAFVDLTRTSNLSCSDARAILAKDEAARDYCAFPPGGGQDFTKRFSYKKVVSTGSCP